MAERKAPQKKAPKKKILREGVQKEKTEKARASDGVKVNARLRKMHPWFEELMEPIKEESVRKRRKSERTRGVKLSPERLASHADALEALQKELNPLENRRRELVKILLAHWGHTGISEIESLRGRTLITASFELCFDADEVRREVGMAHWHALTERVLQPGRLLTEAADSPHLRETVEHTARVRRVKISVISPSSRRPKSGETDGDGEDD